MESHNELRNSHSVKCVDLMLCHTTGEEMPSYFLQKPGFDTDLMHAWPVVETVIGIRVEVLKYSKALALLTYVLT